MATDKKQNSNYYIDDWKVDYEEICFAEPPNWFELDWYSEKCKSENIGLKPVKGKLWPLLIFTYAYYDPKDKSGSSSLKKENKELRNLFSQFCFEGSNKIILNVSIIAKIVGRKETHFIYSHKDSYKIPKENIPNYPKKIYEFINSEFWVKNKLCGEEKQYNILNTSFLLSPFDYVKSTIFHGILKAFNQIECRYTFDPIEFDYELFPLSELVGDVLINPISKMDDKQFKEKLRIIEFYSDPGVFKGNPVLVQKQWSDIPKNKNDLFKLRILDSKYYLNKFFHKYNHSTMKNALELFLIKMYESFGEELVERKLLARCEFCGDFIDYKMGKKHCTLKYEGKDCGKKARNKRNYSKNKSKILPKARKSTKELRLFYKEKNIQK